MAAIDADFAFRHASSPKFEGEAASAALAQAGWGPLLLGTTTTAGGADATHTGVGDSPVRAADMPRVRALMEKYRDLPMVLADAALVRVAERERVRTIFTIDRRDFSVYRPLGLGKFKIVP